MREGSIGRGLVGIGVDWRRLTSDCWAWEGIGWGMGGEIQWFASEGEKMRGDKNIDGGMGMTQGGVGRLGWEGWRRWVGRSGEVELGRVEGWLGNRWEGMKGGQGIGL